MLCTKFFNRFPLYPRPLESCPPIENNKYIEEPGKFHNGQSTLLLTAVNRVYTGVSREGANDHYNILNEAIFQRLRKKPDFRNFQSLFFSRPQSNCGRSAED